MMGRRMRPFRTHVVAPTLAYARRRGVDARALARRCRLPEDAETAPWIEVTLDLLHAFFDAAARATGDDALGARVGAELPRATWDVLQLSCLSAPTLRAAMRRIAVLMPLLHDSVEIAVR